MQKHDTKHKHTHHVSHNLQRDYENIKSILANATQDLKGTTGEMFTHSLKNVQSKSTDVKDSLEDYINKKPFKSVGIAMLAGLVMGYFIRK